MAESTFTCRHCGATSWNPNDALYQYCGMCHHFCLDVDQASRALGLTMKHKTTVKVRLKRDVENGQDSPILPSGGSSG